MKEIIKAYRRLKRMDQASEGNLCKKEYEDFVALVRPIDDSMVQALQIDPGRFKEVMAGDFAPKEIFKSLVPKIDQFLKEQRSDPQAVEMRKELAAKLSSSVIFNNGHAQLDPGALYLLTRDRSSKLIGFENGDGWPHLFLKDRIKYLLQNYDELNGLQAAYRFEDGNLVFKYSGPEVISSEVILYPIGERVPFDHETEALVRFHSGKVPARLKSPNREEISKDERLPSHTYQPSFPSWGLKSALIEGTANLLERIFAER